MDAKALEQKGTMFADAPEVPSQKEGLLSAKVQQAKEAACYPVNKVKEGVTGCMNGCMSGVKAPMSLLRGRSRAPKPLEFGDVNGGQQAHGNHMITVTSLKLPVVGKQQSWHSRMSNQSMPNHSPASHVSFHSHRSSRSRSSSCSPTSHIGSHIGHMSSVCSPARCTPNGGHTPNSFRDAGLSPVPGRYAKRSQEGSRPPRLHSRQSMHSHASIRSRAEGSLFAEDASHVGASPCNGTWSAAASSCALSPGAKATGAARSGSRRPTLLASRRHMANQGDTPKGMTNFDEATQAACVNTAVCGQHAIEASKLVGQWVYKEVGKVITWDMIRDSASQAGHAALGAGYQAGTLALGAGRQATNMAVEAIADSTRAADHAFNDYILERLRHAAAPSEPGSPISKGSDGASTRSSSLGARSTRDQPRDLPTDRAEQARAARAARWGNAGAPMLQQAVDAHQQYPMHWNGPPPAARSLSFQAHTGAQRSQSFGQAPNALRSASFGQDALGAPLGLGGRWGSVNQAALVVPPSPAGSQYSHLSRQRQAAPHVLPSPAGSMGWAAAVPLSPAGSQPCISACTSLKSQQGQYHDAPQCPSQRPSSMRPPRASSFLTQQDTVFATPLVPDAPQPVHHPQVSAPRTLSFGSVLRPALPKDNMDMSIHTRPRPHILGGLAEHPEDPADVYHMYNREVFERRRGNVQGPDSSDYSQHREAEDVAYRPAQPLASRRSWGLKPVPSGPAVASAWPSDFHAHSDLRPPSARAPRTNSCGPVPLSAEVRAMPSSPRGLVGMPPSPSYMRPQPRGLPRLAMDRVVTAAA